MSTLGIPCQQFNTADELKTLSRSVLSVDAQRMLGVLDCAMKKILIIFGLDKLNELNCENEKLNQRLRMMIKQFSKLSQRYSEILPTNVNDANTVGDQNGISENVAQIDENNQQDSKNTEAKLKGAVLNISEQEAKELKESMLLTVRELLWLIRKSPCLEQQLTQNCITVKPCSSSTLSDLNLPLSVSNFPEACSQAYLPEVMPRPRSHLMRCFLELRSTVFSNMLTTPEDRKRKKKYIKEVSNRLNENQAKVDGLTKELDAIVAKNTARVQATTNKVCALQQEVKNLEKYMCERSQRIKKEEAEKSQAIEEKYNNECAELEKELKELTKAYNDQVEENRMLEKKERANLFKLETELEAKISKYDEEMSLLKEEYDTLDEEYTQEKKELNELEERFQTLEEEYLHIMEERRIEEERIRREEEKRQALEQAVTTIQAYWRSYKTRKMARSGRGGKKKK